MDPYASIFTQAKPADTALAAPAAPPVATPYDTLFKPAGGSPTENLEAAPLNTDKYALSEVPGKMAENFGPDFMNTISALGEGAVNMVKAVAEHPGASAKDAFDFATDVAGITKHYRDEIAAGKPSAARKIVDGLIESYGSWDKAKTTAADHPAQFLMDLASFLPLAPKGTGAVGKTLRGAAETLDPSRLPTTLRRAATLGGDVAGTVADQAVQSLEGIAPGALKEMFESGKDITPGVWKTLTHGLDHDAIYGQLKGDLGKLFEKRADNYDALASVIKGADKPVDFAKVDAAVNKAAKIGTYKAPGDLSAGPGYQFERDATVMDARAKIIAEVERYRMMGPAYHTAFGFDKLKQAIRTIGDGLKDGSMPTRGSKFATDVSKAVRDTISGEVPEYGKWMNTYKADSDTIKDMIKEFSLTDNSNKLTTLRKLQKVWRNTADVANGERTEQLRSIVQQTGDKSMMGKLAAGQFHPWMPKGLRGTFLPAEAILNPSAFGKLMPFMSPRIAGTLAYGAGRASQLPGVRPAGRGLAGIGRGVEAASPFAIRGQQFMDRGDEPQQARGGYFSGRG